MPRLEIHLNHEEFKLKSELHIKNWKKISSVENKQAALAISQFRNPYEIFCMAANFRSPCIFTTPAKFRKFAALAKFRKATNFRSL